MNEQYLDTNFPLVERFFPTAYKSGEIRKAEIKNENLPYLQLMYSGDPCTPLYCLITKRNGWISVKDFGTGKDKQRFILDFNHIRQKCNFKRQAGTSVDKGGFGDPSSWFRSRRLNPSYRERNYCYQYRQKERELDVFEFMTIMPITSEYHSYITQDSAKSDITLLNFEKETWAWCLQNEENFNKTKQLLGIKYFNWITYDWLIDHLSDINYPAIRERITSYKEC